MRAAAVLLRALQVRNFRLFLIGNAVSIVGTGAQTVGQGWLVVHQLGQSGSRLGVVLALNYLPLLVAAPLGGVFADRRERRHILIATQSGLAACAVALALVTGLGIVEYWMVAVISAVAGVVVVFDTPARHSFIAELVGPERVANAVSVNSTVLHVSRFLGPLLAALLIPAFGVASCFTVNAVSFLAVLAALIALRPADMFRVAKQARARGQIADALRHVRAHVELRVPLLLLAAIGTFTMNYAVLLPLLARDVFGSERALGLLTASMSVGSVLGAIYGAWRSNPTVGLLVGAATVLSTGLAAAAALHALPLVLLALVVAGAGHIVFLNGTSALLQSRADPAQRGRVMSFYSQLFLGSTPIGAPVVGAIADHFGPRTAVLVAAAVAFGAAACALPVVRRSPLPRTG